MAEGSGPSENPHNFLQSCQNCLVCYNDFCIVAYVQYRTGKANLLIELCQRHGVILESYKCSTCDDQCHLDGKKSLSVQQDLPH